MEIIEADKTAQIELLGQIFKGLKAIDDAVEVRTQVTESYFWDREIERKTPRAAVDGVHVLCMYERYPCFDSSDYKYERREYCNYFFSTEPFTDERIEQLAKMKIMSNYRMVSEHTPADALPAIYFGGSSIDKLLVARGNK